MSDHPEINRESPLPYTRYRLEYEKQFRRLSNEELTAVFNSATGIPAWNIARAAQVDALIGEFEYRKMDWSVIGDEHARSLKYCVLLIGKTFYRLTSFEYRFVAELLEQFFQSKSSLQQPVSIELVAFDDRSILYRMAGNTDTLQISVKEVVLKVI